MITVHYALQTHDASSRESFPRYASLSKIDIIQKSVTSFLESIKAVKKHKPNDPVKHIVDIFDDHSSKETLDFLDRIKIRYQSNDIQITVHNLPNRGLINSVMECYNSLKNVPADLIYQVQDDYLFSDSAITEMLDMFFKLYTDLKVHPIIMSFNNPLYWAGISNDKPMYKYKVMPKMLVPGSTSYWTNVHDLTCSFLTSKDMLNKHWDLIQRFGSMDVTNQLLEINSVNKMVTERNELCVIPIRSVALHLQDDALKDPYVDWKKLWDSVPKV